MASLGVFVSRQLVKLLPGVLSSLDFFPLQAYGDGGFQWGTDKVSVKCFVELQSQHPWASPQAVCVFLI